MKVKAYNQDTEPSRLSRLNFVANELKAYSHSIYMLYDRKGTLGVYWLFSPTQIMKDIVELSWSNQGENNVEHYYEVQ